MARKPKRTDSDYDIGYGKPPRYTQFKPKQSGNPGGRPTKNPKEPPAEPRESELDDVLKAEFNRKVTVADKDGSKKMSMIEVVTRAQINAAAKGNVVAQRDVLKAKRELELREAERAQALAEQQREKRDQEIRVYHYMVGEKMRRAKIWAEAAAQGREPDNPWPHPDDILLFPDTLRWYPRGPFCSKDVPFYEWLRAERDYAYSYKMLELARKKPRRAWLRMYDLLWISYDVRLPKRWQLFDQDTVEFFRLSILTEKQLERVVTDRKEHADFTKVLARIPPKPDKEVYKMANSIMKPFLKDKGYRSLAEFEAAYEQYGEALPWPKV